MKLNYKHYIAIVIPYLLAAAAAIEDKMQHSPDVVIVALGGLIAATLSHGNVLAHARGS